MFHLVKPCRPILLFVFFSVAALSFSQTASSTIDKQLEEAYALYEKANYQAASSSFSRLLKNKEFSTHTSYPKVLYLYCLLLDSSSESIKFLESNIGKVKEPTFLSASYYLLGLQKDLQGDFDGAITSYKNALFVLNTNRLDTTLFEGVSKNVKLPTYGELNYRLALLSTFVGEDEVAKTYIANIKAKEGKFAFYHLCGVVLESRIAIKSEGVNRSIQIMDNLLQELKASKNQDIPLTLFYWSNYLVKNYPVEAKTLQTGIDSLIASSSKNALALSIKPVIDPALQLSILSPLLTSDSNSTTSEVEINQTSKQNKTVSENKTASTNTAQSETKQREKIQIASFSDKENALYYAKDVKAHGFECQITKTNKGIFRVYVLVKEGELASTTLLKLKDLGYEGMLN